MTVNSGCHYANSKIGHILRHEAGAVSLEIQLVQAQVFWQGVILVRVVIQFKVRVC